MKVQRSSPVQMSSKGKQYHIKPLEGSAKSNMKERRKSGRLTGLSLKSFFSSDSSKSSGKDSDDSGEKSSLLKRLASHRSSRKKKINDNDKTQKKISNDSMADVDGSVGLLAESTSGVKVLQSDKYESLRRTPWGSDDSDSEDNTGIKVKRKKRRNSLHDTGRKLRRSMSMLCGLSRSRATQDMNLTDVIISQKQKNKRRSLGDGILRPMTRNKFIDDASIEEISSDDVNSGKENTSLLQVPSTYNLRNAGSTPKTTDLINSCFLFPDPSDNQTPSCSPTKSKKPKRQSYDRMNKARDSNVLTPKQKNQNIADVPCSEPCGSPPKRRPSLKRGWSSFKLAVTNTTNNPGERQNTAEKGTSDFLQRSSRRKSLGALTPSSERRRSGIYSSALTPTFMTCGFIMTDSPPDQDSNDVSEVIKPLGIKRKRSTRQESLSKQNMAESYQNNPDYNSDDLPWVAMKRKRRSEILEKQQVNRFNAGHTPLPARKKRKSIDDRLV